MCSQGLHPFHIRQLGPDLFFIKPFLAVAMPQKAIELPCFLALRASYLLSTCVKGENNSGAIFFSSVLYKILNLFVIYVRNIFEP